jgi:DNA polymerase III subunit epsilon
MVIRLVIQKWREKNMFGLMNAFRRRVYGIDPSAPLMETTFVVVDTELTGLDAKRDSIVSIGAVRMTGGRIDIGGSYYQLFKPGTALSAESVVIHEITPSEVEEKPLIETALAGFMDFIGMDVLVGHLISIDLEFINKEMKRIVGHKASNPALDTYSIYEWLAARIPDHKCFAEKPARPTLYDIAKCFGIPVSGAHNAMMDAYTTALLFQRFLPLLSEAGIDNIGDLLKAGKPFTGGGQFRAGGEFSNF